MQHEQLYSFHQAPLGASQYQQVVATANYNQLIHNNIQKNVLITIQSQKF